MVILDKKDKYETLCAQIECLSEGENNVVGVLSNVSSAMHETFPENYFWVGFYLVNVIFGNADIKRSIPIFKGYIYLFNKSFSIL